MTTTSRACLLSLPVFVMVAACCAQDDGGAAGDLAPSMALGLMVLLAFGVLGLAVVGFLWARQQRARITNLEERLGRYRNRIVDLQNRIIGIEGAIATPAPEVQMPREPATATATATAAPVIAPATATPQAAQTAICPGELDATTTVTQMPPAPPDVELSESVPQSFDDWLREAADTGRTAATSVLRNLLHAPANVEASLRSGAENQVQSLLGNLDLALYGRVRPEDLPMPDAEERALQIEQRQREWVDTLRSHGLARNIADAGSPFVDGETEDSGEEPSPTTDPSKEGRIAGVKPGNGGYQLHGRILSVTKARKYVYQPTDR